MEISFNVVSDQFRILVHDVLVAWAWPDQRVLTLHHVSMLMIGRDEDTSVGDDKRSEHTLMVSNDSAFLRDFGEDSSIVTEWDHVIFHLIPKRG